MPGTLIAARYRLERRVSMRGLLSLWRGDDLVLARPVAVHILTGTIDAAQTRRFIDAAVAAGQVISPAATATFDADDLGDLSYVVSEWVEGVSLAQLLSDGPLPNGRMRGLLLPVATMLAEAHAHGVQHGRLQPSDVVVTGHGGVKVLGLGLLAPDGTHPDAGSSPTDNGSDASNGASTAPRLPGTLSNSAEERADVRALGALVYASLTGRWPLTGTELPPAPLDEAGRICAPRQVRAGVTRQADAIATAALGLDGRQTVAPLRSAAEVAAALDSLPYEQDPPTPPIASRAPRPATAIPPRRPSSPAYSQPGPRRRRVSPLAAGVVLIAAIAAVISVVLALTNSGSNGSSSTPPASAPTSAKPASPAAVLTPSSFSDFDPYGQPPSEQPQLVPLAHDNNPTTAWLTETYTNAQLGSLKPGVGLRLDMGRPVTVGQLQLTFPFAGQAVEVRAGDTDSTAIDSYPVVWSNGSAGTSALAKPNTTAPHRYWVIWLTRLVPQNGGFQGGVSEIVVHS
jgi:putative peptidoglycan lipid II flippase